MNNDNNNNTYNTISSVVLKYWIGIRWGIAMRHGKAGIFRFGWWTS